MDGSNAALSSNIPAFFFLPYFVRVVYFVSLVLFWYLDKGMHAVDFSMMI
jgi:hypothetical protein